MIRKTIYSPYYYIVSRHLTLSDFGMKINGKIPNEKQFSNGKNSNMFLNFIEKTYNSALIVFSKYSNDYSNHLYTQPQLFTILAAKIYLKSTYRGIIDILEPCTEILKFLGLSKLPHYTTIQKFFERLSDTQIKYLNDYLLLDHPEKSELIALDGTGHTSDYADKYYAQIRTKKRKGYTKNHITIDVDTRMILHYGVSRGPKHDTKFALAAIRQTKKYNPHYILADRAYDSEEIRKTINEEVKAFDQIPLKTRAKKGHYRINSSTIFRPKVYGRRMNVESVIFVIKQKFSGINFSRSENLRNKETKLKDVLYNIYRYIQIF